MTHPLTLVRTPDTGREDLPQRSPAGRRPVSAVSATPAPIEEVSPAGPVAVAAPAADQNPGPGAPVLDAPDTPAASPEATDHDAGMSTVEYAVGTVVAAAFAAVLYRIVTGDSIVAGLTSLVQSALNTNF